MAHDILLKVLAIALGLTVTACGKGERQSLVGNYTFSGSGYVANADTAKLILRQNAVYQFCVSDTPCEAGTYNVEQTNGDFDRVHFSGSAMKRFIGGDIGNVKYSGWSCPCILVGDPDGDGRFSKSSN